MTENMETISRKSLLYKTNVEYGDYCINHVLGCSHGCLYPCYAFLLKKRTGAVKDYKEWTEPKIVGNAIELLEKESKKHNNLKSKSVHLCFTTDPFMYQQPEIISLTQEILAYLIVHTDVQECTVLTKGIYQAYQYLLTDNFKYGITLVSLSEDFRKKYEPGAAPIKARIEALYHMFCTGAKTWVSMEPYPTPNVIKQDIEEILNAIKFVDKIVFGCMNYNSLTSGYEEFYKEQAKKVSEFCSKNGIECYIKKGTI